MSDDAFERLRANVDALRVAQARTAGRVRNLELNGPAADVRLQRDVDRLTDVVDRLDAQLETLQRWQWKVTGIAAGVAFVVVPLWEAVLHAIGVH